MKHSYQVSKQATAVAAYEEVSSETSTWEGTPAAPTPPAWFPRSDDHTILINGDRIIIREEEIPEMDTGNPSGGPTDENEGPPARWRPTKSELEKFNEGGGALTWDAVEEELAVVRHLGYQIRYDAYKVGEYPPFHCSSEEWARVLREEERLRKLADTMVSNYWCKQPLGRPYGIPKGAVRREPEDELPTDWIWTSGPAWGSYMLEYIGTDVPPRHPLIWNEERDRRFQRPKLDNRHVAIVSWPKDGYTTRKFQDHGSEAEFAKWGPRSYVTWRGQTLNWPVVAGKCRSMLFRVILTLLHSEQALDQYLHPERARQLGFAPVIPAGVPGGKPGYPLWYPLMYLAWYILYCPQDLPGDTGDCAIELRQFMGRLELREDTPWECEPLEKGYPEWTKGRDARRFANLRRQVRVLERFIAGRFQGVPVNAGIVISPDGGFLREVSEFEGDSLGWGGTLSTLHMYEVGMRVLYDPSVVTGAQGARILERRGILNRQPDSVKPLERMSKHRQARKRTHGSDRHLLTKKVMEA